MRAPKPLWRLILNRLQTLRKHRSTTIEFPFVQRQPPQGTRGSLKNNFADCIGCHRCEQVCPVQCLNIISEDFSIKELAPRTSGGVIFEKRVTSFNIDFTKCVNCGVCVDECPTGSLTNDRHFVVPRFKPKNLHVDLVYQPRTLRKEQGYED